MATSDGSAGERTLVAAGLISLVVGSLLAVLAAYALVDKNGRQSTFGLVIGSAIAFLVLSICLERVLDAHADLTGFLRWLAVSVLTLVFLIGFGYLAVGWTQKWAVPLRLLVDLVVAVLAGIAVALLIVVGGWAVAGALKLAALVWHRIKPPPSAAASKLQQEEKRWEPPKDTGDRTGKLGPLQRLLLRTTSAAVGGVALAVAAQALAYALDMGAPWQKLALPLLGWFVGSGLTWICVKRLMQNQFTPGRHRTRHLVHALGLAVVLLVAVTIGFAEVAAHGAKGALWKQDSSRTYGAADAQATATGDAALAQAFAPRLRFTKDERWHPTSVDWFLANTKVVQPFKVGKQIRCAKTCLDVGCDDVAGDCTKDAPAAPTIYVLVRHDGLGSQAPPRYDDVTTVLQYWLFYNYDAFDRWPISQWHQGDWEQVSVGLAGAKPRFVAYSQHCFGTWLPWSRVEVDGAGSTHPVAYVGEGTHANYPRDDDFPLRGASCAGNRQPRYYGALALAFALAEPGGRLEVPADYAFGETDRTAQEAGPDFELRLVEPADEKLASFPGTWGLDNRLGFGRSKNGSFAGGGPDSPALHGEWTEPGKNMLCDPTWFTPPKRQRCRVRS